jgi:hypothetical protein
MRERREGGEEKQARPEGHLRRLASQTSVLFGCARLADAMLPALYFPLVFTSVNNAYTILNCSSPSAIRLGPRKREEGSSKRNSAALCGI